MSYSKSYLLPENVKEFILKTYYYKDGNLYTRNKLWGRHGRSKEDPIGELTTSGYKYISINRNDKRYRIPVSHIIWFLHYNEFPKLTLDHINRDKRDNRIENLRELNQTHQNYNQKTRKDNKLGLRNISWDKTRKLYQIMINKGGKRILFKRTKTLEEAMALRDTFIKENNLCLN